MPIPIRCQCGKNLKVPDNLAGKAVKCPACSKPVKVPAASSEPDGEGLDDLFNEEGFSNAVEAICPKCRAEMKKSAVLCTKCGYHIESGTVLASHKTAGLDIDHGTLALQKAEGDIQIADAMQQKMLKGSGLPWWGLALVLFVIGSGLTIAVLTVNASRRVDEDITFNPMGLFLLLTGIAFAMIALGAYWMIMVHSFRNIGKMGALTIIPPYTLYYVYMNFRGTWKYMLTCIVTGGIAGAMIAEATARGI